MNLLFAILFPFSFWMGGICADPVLGPNPGVYSHRTGGLNVTISTSTLTAHMRYTTNGTNPTTVSGTLVSSYTTTIHLATNTVTDVRAIAFVPSGPVSNVTQGVYEVYSGDPP